MGWALTPYSVLTAGADVAILKWQLPAVGLRFGFFGLIELESDQAYSRGSGTSSQREIRASGAPTAATRSRHPSNVSRGVDSVSSGAFRTLPVVAARERALHGLAYGGRAHVRRPPAHWQLRDGDAAIRIPLARLRSRAPLAQPDLDRRSAHTASDPAQTRSCAGGSSTGPTRSPPLRRVPFGRQTTWHDGRHVRVPDDYLVRNLTGVAFPRKIRRDPDFFNAIEVGHGKGLNVFHEELRWGGGIRLAFY